MNSAQILEEEIQRAVNDARNSLIVKSLSNKLNEDSIYKIGPEILKVVPIARDLCRVFLSEASRPQVVKNRMLEKLKNLVQVSNYQNEDLINWLKKYEPYQVRLRLANCFDMTDSEGLGYFSQALSFKTLKKDQGVVLVEFRNHDTAMLAFMKAKKIVRPIDAEGYERPPLLATFDRYDTLRKIGKARKSQESSTKLVQQVDDDSDSGGSSIIVVSGDEDDDDDDEGQRLANLDRRKRKREEADPAERRQNIDLAVKREKMSREQQCLSSCSGVADRQTPSHCQDPGNNSFQNIGNNNASLGNPGYDCANVSALSPTQLETFNATAPRTSSAIRIRQIQDIADAMPSTSGAADNICTTKDEKAQPVEVKPPDTTHLTDIPTGQAAQIVAPFPPTPSVFEQYKAFDPLAESLRKTASTHGAVGNSPGVGHFIDQLISSGLSFDTLFTDFATRQEHLRAEWLRVMWSHLAQLNRLDPSEQDFYLQNTLKFLQQNYQNQ